MPNAKGRSKLLKVYQDKKSGAIFLNPTKYSNGRFVLKSPVKNYGISLSSKVSDSNLGKEIKKKLKNCD